MEPTKAPPLKEFHVTLVGPSLQDPRVSGTDVASGQLTDKSQRRSDHGLSQSSVFMGQDSNDLRMIGLWHPGIFYVRGPAKFQLENDLGKNLRHSLRKGPKFNLSRNSESNLVKVLRDHSSEEIKSDLSHSGNGSGNDLSMCLKENLD